MSKLNVPDFLVKSSVSTTETWGFIKDSIEKHSVNGAGYKDFDDGLLSARTSQEFKFQDAIWVCERHRWRPITKEVCLKDSSTDLESQGDMQASLANFESACNMLYHWEGHKQGRLASVYVVFFVEKNFASMNLEAVNSLLLEVSLKRITEWSMIAILRSSYSARQMLPAWEGFFRAVQKALEGNERAPRLLAGLDD